MPGAIVGQQVSNLSSQTYTVRVTDINGCVTTASTLVNEPTVVVLTTSAINSDCGNANGIATSTVTGGTSGYTYTWQPAGGNASTASNLFSGNYSLTVTDAKGCVASKTQTVGNNPGPNVTIVSTTSVSCFGGNNATATSTVIGGTGPFTYTWQPTGGNTNVGTNLSSANYTVFVTAGNGCLANAVTSLIAQPTQVFATTSGSNVSCFGGNNGTATVTAFGGNASYTYTWLPSNTTGSSIATLSAGIYTVITKDITNCQTTNTIAITQPSVGLSAIASSTIVSCFGGSDGKASVIATGGTSPYSYQWMPVSVNSQTVGSLSMGIYTIEVTDLKNCKTTATVEVLQPLVALTATATSAATSCSGGSNGTGTITAQGGTAGYTYSWSPSGGTNASASGLSQGNYLVNVVDTKNCQTNVIVVVSSPTAVSGSLTTIPAACGLSNGSLSSQITGGTGPYTYTWLPTNTYAFNNNNVPTANYTLNTTDSKGCPLSLTASVSSVAGPTLVANTATNVLCFSGNNGAGSITINQGTAPYTINWLPYGGSATTSNSLSVGVYTISVEDARNCITHTIITISEPTQLALTLNGLHDVSCFGLSDGSATVTASGGTPLYAYTWLPTGNTNTLSGMPIGTYTVRVADSNSCATSMVVSITQPMAMSTSITNSINATCFNSTNGSATANTTGGSVPYTYSWTTSSLQTGVTATNLTAGTYTAFVTDINGCASSATVTLTQPAQVLTNTGLNDTICLNQAGEVTAFATGGSGGYYYAWQPGGIINSGTLTVNPALASINYSVVAYDQFGCAGQVDTVKAVVYALTNSNINAVGFSPICPNMATTIYAETFGDTGPLSFSWNNGLGTGLGAFVTIPTQASTYYVVTVTNACGQTMKDSVQVVHNPQPTISVISDGTLSCIPASMTFTDSSVAGNSNDPITNWTWNFGDGTTSNNTNPSLVYSTPGTYSVTLTVSTDGGCINNNNSTPIIINAYASPIAQFSINATELHLPQDALICTNQSIGAVSYDWSFGDGGTSSDVHPHYFYTSVGDFQIQLIAISLQGCRDTAYAYVKTDADFVFPNAFTPNEDGSSNGGYYTLGSLDNDIFFPYTSGVVEYKLQIFNRWGELIFETTEIKQGWDGYYKGKLCQLGVYVWKASARLNNGKTHNLTGDVTLLR